MSNLINNTYSYIKNNKNSKYFIILTIINDFILILLSSYLMIKISNGEKNIIPIFLILQGISPIINNFIIQPLIKKISIDIRKKYEEESYLRYYSISFEDKITRQHQNFDQKLMSSMFALTLNFSWGLPNLINLISSFSSVFLTFLQKGLILQFGLAVLLFCISYKTFVESKQNNFTLADKLFRKIRHKISEKIYLDGISFQYKELTPDYMIKLKNIISSNEEVNELNWQKIMAVTNFNAEIISIIICYFTMNNTSDFILISMNMTQLSRSIQKLTSFTTQYNKYYNDWETMEEFWKNTTVKEEPSKLYLSTIPNNKFEITDVLIKLGNYNLRLDPNFTDFNICKKSKILLEGPSGHGKSSFIKSLFGLFDNCLIKLDHGEGKNYHHLIADYFQEIKEKMPSSKVSIRDYFKGEKNNDIITQYLLYAWSSDELDRISTSILNSNNDDINININIKNIHIYDLSINERLSGGQKSRLILWTRGYIVETLQKEIIVLDEPCPDVDFDNYIDNITRFYNKYKHCTIIMIAHLCECRRKAINADKLFNLEIWIENGIISKRK
jgi:ABC-type cobalamin/Fe3+-siderophores transport system ATPase subunit